MYVSMRLSEAVRTRAPLSRLSKETAQILSKNGAKLAFREIVNVSPGHVYEAQISISAFSLSPSET